MTSRRLYVARQSIQATVALDKAKRPEVYCPERRCLWRTGGGRCPRHGGRPVAALTEVAQYRMMRRQDEVV